MSFCPSDITPDEWEVPYSHIRTVTLRYVIFPYTELLRPFIKAVCVINAFNETDFLLLTDFHTSFIAVSPYFFIIPQLAAFPCYDEVSKVVDQLPHVTSMRKAVWTNVSQFIRVNVSPRESSTKNSFLKSERRYAIL